MGNPPGSLPSKLRNTFPEVHAKRRYMRFIFLLTVLLVYLLPVPEALPADLADCRGEVLDENSVPVEGAVIKLQQETGATYEGKTNASGWFTIHGIPPGEYRAEVHKEGFFLLSGQHVTLHAGSNELVLTLNHEQEVHERVQVAAPQNEIDTQETAQKEALTARNIRDIPVPSSHDLQKSLVALPQVLPDNSGNLHVAGARSSETQYLLDGFEIGDPVTGNLSARFNVDATRAAAVETGRFGASYPHAGAGILSLETPDGDDRWRFGTTNPIPGINVQQDVRLGNWYPRFTFSGPLQRGRFWFADSLSVQHTFSIVRQQPPAANTVTQWGGDDLLRLQYNLTPNHILHASLLYNRADDSNLGLSALDPQSTTVDGTQHRTFVSLKDQVWLHNTLFELGLAADGDILEYTPQGTQPYVLMISGTSGNYFQQLHRRGRRVQAIGNLTTARHKWHGDHQFAAGFNLAELAYSQSAGRGEIDALRADGTVVRRTIFQGPAHLRATNSQAGGFFQDTFTPSKRLVFQAGLRTDWDRFTETAMLEPRFSGNFLPFGNDAAKLSLGWGISNSPVNLSLVAQAYDQVQVDSFYNRNTLTMGPFISQFALPSGGLHQPRFTISSAGYQQKIRRSTLLGVELLVRNGYHSFAYVKQQPAHPGGILLLEDHRKDRYRAATFSARYQFSDSAEFYGAYTRSRATSNQVLNPALGSIFYAGQRAGRLPWDAPNRLVTWGWVPTHIWGLQLSYFFEYRTGYPFSLVNFQQQLIGANVRRFPSYASLNLGLEKKFAFGGYLWAARIMVVNALARDNFDAVVNNVDAPNFGAFLGGQGRAFTGRVRFVGRK